jgi:hypothetical protein
VKLEDVTLQGFNQAGVRLTNCSGDTSKPVVLQRLRIVAPREVEAALYFDVNPSFTASPYNQNIRIRDCRFEGPYRGAVQFNVPEQGKGIALAAATDVEISSCRFFNMTQGIVYNKQKAGPPAPKITLTVDSNTFCDVRGIAIYCGKMPTSESRITIKNNLFAKTGVLAKVEGVDGKAVAQVFPSRVGNVRDMAAKEDNLSLGAKAIGFEPLPTEAGDDKTFLRYPKSSELARAGEDGKPVGAGPQPD